MFQNCLFSVCDYIFTARDRFFLKHSTDADAHKHTHTHPCEYTHDPTLMSTSERLCQRILEIDKVTTGTSLSTGISPTAIELRSVRVIPNH